VNHIDDRFDEIERRLKTAVTQRAFINLWLCLIFLALVL
jgi:hypothetical protein